MNVYKKYYKHYKYTSLLTNLEEVLDFHTQPFDYEQVKPIELSYTSRERLPFLRLSCNWQAYEILNCPGLIYIRNPFTPSGQKYWIAKLLRDYPKLSNSIKLYDSNNVFLKINQLFEFYQLRSVSFGYNQGSDMEVDFESLKSSLPVDISLMCNYFAKALNYPYFTPEAAIVNYYHIDSNLCGHTVESIRDCEAPFITFSFGQSSIFLVGKNIYEKPTALIIHSGDVVVMSKESRLYLHNIPRIIPESDEIWKKISSEDHEMDLPERFQCDTHESDDFLASCENYLNKFQLSVSVRQVVKRAQKRVIEDQFDFNSYI